MGRNIFITGITSRVGIKILSNILENTEDVCWVLVRLKENEIDPYGRMEKIMSQRINPIDLEMYRDRIQIVKGDLTKRRLGLDDKTFFMLRDSGVDEVFHIAAHSDRTEATMQSISNVNVEGTYRLLKYAEAVKCPVINFTSQLYSIGKREGVVPEGPFPRDDYAFNNVTEFTKHLAENVIERFCAEHKISFRIFRLGLLIDATNFAGIEHQWRYYLYKTMVESYEYYKQVFSAEQRAKQPFMIPGKEHVQVYMTQPGYAAKIMLAAMGEGESTYNQYFHVYDRERKVSELLVAFQYAIGTEAVELVDSVEKLPPCEKKVFDSSLAFVEYMVQEKSFLNEKAKELEEKHGIVPEPLRVEDLLAAIDVMKEIYAKEKKPASPGLFKKLIMRASTKWTSAH